MQGRLKHSDKSFDTEVEEQVEIPYIFSYEDS